MSRPALADLIRPGPVPPAQETLARARLRNAAHERETARWRERMAAANEDLAEARQAYRDWAAQQEARHARWITEMNTRLTQLKGNQP